MLQAASIFSTSISTIYEGQELISIIGLTVGSQATVSEANFGIVSEFTSLSSSQTDIDLAAQLGRPLNLEDRITATLSLCDKKSTTKTISVVNCETIPAPQIRAPLDGENFISVIESVAGARIRIYNNNGIELGDGSGTIIILSMNLGVDDIVTAVQQIGNCTSKNGHTMTVRKPGSD